MPMLYFSSIGKVNKIQNSLYKFRKKMHFQTLAATQISWKNCHKNSDGIKLVNLTINPYPIVTPGSFSVEITVHNDKDISSPLKVRFVFLSMTI